MPATTAEQVVEFWFSERARKHWFVRSSEFDTKVADELGELSHRAKRGDLTPWAESSVGLLALVVLLDQVPRNIYRNQAEAFSGDGLALKLAKLAIERKWDTQFTAEQRLFLYLPFEHSENLDHQHTAVELMHQLSEPMWIDYAKRHLDVIERFGRFPHRNAALGRASTVEELAFLQQPGSSF